MPQPNAADAQVAAHFRELRQEHGLTQADVAYFGAGLVDRAFLARVETRGLPRTVKKFLTLARMLLVDLDLIAELCDLRPLPVSRERPLPYNTALAEMMKATAVGNFPRAAGYAFAILEDSRSPTADPRDEGRALVGLAAISRFKGSLDAARYFVERALRAKGLGQRNRFRSLLLLAEIEHARGLDEIAEALMNAITPEAREADVYLAAKFDEFKAFIELEAGRFEAAIVFGGRAASSTIDDPDLHARGTMACALAQLGLDRPTEALRSANRALSIARDTEDQGLISLAWIRRGNVLEASGDLHTALGCYDQALALAEELHHDRLHAKASLFLGRVLARLGRRGAARRHLRTVRRISVRIRLDRETAALLATLEPQVLGDHPPAAARPRRRSPQ